MLNVQRLKEARLEKFDDQLTSLPSMIAINPPVEVPTMRSKQSQGLDKFGSIKCIRRFKVMRLESPRTPPPSTPKR